MTEFDMFNILLELTKGFRIPDMILHTDFEDEKNQAVKILKNFYEVVEVSDGRMSNDEPPCWVIAITKRMDKRKEK